LSGPRDVNLAVVQETVAAAVPDRVAVIHRDRSLTYGEFTARTRRLANWLLAAGVAQPDHSRGVPGWETDQACVLIVSRNRPEYLEAMYGSYKARCAPGNVNFRYTAAEMAALFADAAPAVVVVESVFAPVVASALPAGCRVLQLEDSSGGDLLPGATWYEDALGSASDARPDVEWSPDDRYLLFTGGTIGHPKGALWRQADIYPAAVHGRKHALFGTDDEPGAAAAVAAAGPPLVVLPLPPFMHGAAQWLAMACLHAGDTVVIQDDVDHFDPPDVWRTVERHRVQALLIVGDAFGRPLLSELERGSYDVSSLMILTTGGAVTSETLKKGLMAAIPQVMILDVAGSSESGGLLRHIDAGGNASSGEFTADPDTVIVSDDRSRFLVVGDDSIGWLGRTGPMPLGYLHDQAKTESTFITVEGQRVCVPGDRASFTAAGSVLLLGREAVTINTGGEKVFAEEVEQALLSHPAVLDALAVGRPHERWGQEVVAVVCLASGSSASLDELVAHCRLTLAPFKVPKDVVWVDAVQRTPAGKADYAWARSVVSG
jgi:acyl-CoA synthetase (AMP-forming)/AMP-acid ligase II